MRIEPFAIEQWMDAYETGVAYNLAETCVKPFTVQELLALTGDSLNDLLDLTLSYGHITGTPGLRRLLAGLYREHDPDNILIMNGAIGANFLVFYSLVEPGDTVISVFPAYEQLYRVAESFGAQVKRLRLRPEAAYQPNLDELASLIDERTKLIVINNPHNPTGALLETDTLAKICVLAESCGAYVLCDEAYRGLYIHSGDTVPSLVDLSERAIVTGSFAKTYSLAGLRLGWLAAPPVIVAACMLHRDYTTISCGQIDERLAVMALSHRERIMERNLTLLRRNARIVAEWVAEQPLVSYTPPRAGTTAFLHYDLPVPSRQVCLELVRKHSTLLAPGDCFECENYLRLGFACDTQILQTGLARLSTVLDELQRKHA